MTEEVVAVVLAAGLGSRLRPATVDCPKTLIEVGPQGETVLEFLAQQCLKAGMSELLIVTGHGHDQVERYLARWQSPLPIRTVFNPDYARMNNARSLMIARPHINNRTFVKFDGDLVLHRDILPRLMAARQRSAIILDDKAKLTAEDMKANIDRNTGRVLEFGKWLPNSASGLSIGVERIAAEDSPVVFGALEQMIDVDHEVDGYYEDAYHRVLDHGLWLGHVTTGGLPWIEIDTPEELADACALVARLLAAAR